jgi:hypothetical protein
VPLQRADDAYDSSDRFSGVTAKVRVPVHMMDTVSKVVRTSRQLLNEIGREPTPEEFRRLDLNRLSALEPGDRTGQSNRRGVGWEYLTSPSGGVMKDAVEHNRGQDGVAGRFFSPSMRPIKVSSAPTVSPARPLGVMPTTRSASRRDAT